MSCSRATTSDLGDAIGNPFQPLAAVDFGIALAGEYAADRARDRPAACATAIKVAWRSTARLRASGSGLVKSGEQQSIGIAKPAAAIASPPGRDRPARDW